MHVVGKVYRHLDVVNKRMVINQQTASKYESLAFDGNLLLVLLDGELSRYLPFEV
jgi:hypothetical protein